MNRSSPHISEICKPQHIVSGDIPAPRLPEVQSFQFVTPALVAMSEQLFRNHSAFTDQRLYTLVGLAAAFQEFARPSLLLKDFDDDLLLGAKTRNHDEGSESQEQIAELLNQFSALKQDDQKLVSFLVASIPDDRPVATQAYEFFESTGRRAFGFEDVLKAAVLLRVLLHQGLDGGLDKNLEPESYQSCLLKHERNFRAGYVNRRDLEALQINEDSQIETLIEEVLLRQLDGALEKRSSALYYAAISSNRFEQLTKVLPEISQHSGAELAQFIMMRPREELEFLEGYRVRTFRTISRQQFPASALDKQIFNELQISENYPSLEREMNQFGIRPDEIVQRLRSGDAQSLVELDAFCEGLQWKRRFYPQMRGSLRDAVHTTGSAGMYALVERMHDSNVPSIALGLGYQGENHTGMGLRHVLHQRGRDGVVVSSGNAPRNKEFGMHEFINDALFYVAGTSVVRVPSSKLPDTHMLLCGPVRGEGRGYMSLVVARTIDPLHPEKVSHQVITALYHAHVGALRKTLLNEVRNWVETMQERSVLSKEHVLEILNSVNSLLINQHAAIIPPSDVFEEDEVELLAFADDLDLRPAEATFDSAVGVDFTELDSLEADVFSLEAVDDDDDVNVTYPKKALRGFATPATVGRSPVPPPPPEEFQLDEEGLIFNPVLSRLL